MADGRYEAGSLLGSGHVTYAEGPDEFETAVRVFAAEVDRRWEDSMSAGTTKGRLL